MFQVVLVIRSDVLSTGQHVRFAQHRSKVTQVGVGDTGVPAPVVAHVVHRFRGHRPPAQRKPEPRNGGGDGRERRRRRRKHHDDGTDENGTGTDENGTGTDENGTGMDENGTGTGTERTRTARERARRRADDECSASVTSTRP